MTLARGRFITLEGGEGAGKSTQAARLAEALRAAGKTVVATREPGGTPGAEAIRALLMTGDADRWTPEAEALLFAAARADHVARVIRPALERGEWVVCDRFLDSTRAYQGGGGGMNDADIITLHRIGSGGLLPDRTILLSLATEDGTARATARDGEAADRFAAKGGAYGSALAKAFARLAAAEPTRFRTIEAEGSIEDVAAGVLAAIEDLL